MLLGWGCFSCNHQPNYYDLVEEELSSGIRVDSLFLDIKFGMSSKEFFKHCWELNKAGELNQGAQNITVLYKIQNSEKPISMDFYPTFHDDKIYEMPVVFTYENWAPWNENTKPEVLQMEVLEVFKEWYGEDFIEVKHPTAGSAFVKVDGNRRISIFIGGEKEVKALFTDLVMDKQLASKGNNSPFQ